MVAYLKASTNEKMYSNYFWAAREAEKEEVAEPSHSQMTDDQPKPKAMSFFPLWKLKGMHPVKNPTVWVVHLEEDSGDKEESAKSDDPSGIEGVTEEFINAPGLGSEGSPTGWEMLTTIAAAQNILSASAHWWRHQGQLPI